MTASNEAEGEVLDTDGTDSMDLSISCRPKIEIINEQRSAKSPAWLPVLKWCFTIVLFCASLFCLSASKIYFVYVATSLNNGTLRVKVGGLENSSLILTATNDVLLKHFRLGLDGVGRLSV